MAESTQCCCKERFASPLQNAPSSLSQSPSMSSLARILTGSSTAAEVIEAFTMLS
jgi:hypothetical protein